MVRTTNRTAEEESRNRPRSCRSERQDPRLLDPLLHPNKKKKPSGVKFNDFLFYFGRPRGVAGGCSDVRFPSTRLRLPRVGHVCCSDKSL